jgi:hypothetical protein
MSTVDDDSHWRWLASTERLQYHSFGNVVPMEDDELADFAMMNFAAAVKELGEALDEVGWKPWATPRGWVNRDAYIRELVDATHFVANLLVAVGCTDDEFWVRYRAKQQLNARRQADGYDGVTGKCHVCHRALDDGDEETESGAHQVVCIGCGAVQRAIATAHAPVLEAAPDEG